MSQFETAVLPTPAGPLAVIVDPDTGAVVASGFDGLADQQGRLDSGPPGARLPGRRRAHRAGRRGGRGVHER